WPRTLGVLKKAASVSDKCSVVLRGRAVGLRSLNGKFDVPRDYRKAQEEDMATSIPKSYQAKIKYPTPPSGPAGLTFPHTFSEKLFQVPAGKTWQVLKFLLRDAPLRVQDQDPVEFLRIEKANSDGTEQILLIEFVRGPDGKIQTPSPYDVTEIFRDMVLEDQE